MARDEQGNVIFDVDEQAMVDKIVQERVARVKSEKPSDYDDYKAIGEELQALGYKGTPSEIKAEIKALREQSEAQAELESLQEQAQKEGTSPQLLAEIKNLKKEISELKTDKEKRDNEKIEKQKKSEEDDARETYYKQQCDALLEKHNVDAEQLEKNAKFMKFVKGKTITDLVEVYEDFVEFVGETEAESIKKVMAKEIRSTSGGKGTNPGGNYGLTDAQKALVDEWNAENPSIKMSYKQFAEKL